MSDWHLRPMAAFDLETTGTDVETDRVVTAAVIRIDPSTGGKQVRSWLADPGVEIPVEASDIHGVTTERARAEGRPAAEVLGEIAAELTELTDKEVPLVAFNAAFDLTLLDRELTRHGSPTDFGGRMRVIDPMVLDRQIDRYRKGSRRLVDVCAHYGIRLDPGDAHGCEADALAAARLAWRLGSTRPELAAMDIDDLHQAQRAWRAEQAASLEAYLRRAKDPQAVVERDWPLIPAR
ncbi:exonuclease domain-containing protein [Nocardiopsis composta]|uniref:DNA polymerase-3 subunit epsilon n=1 Tax=Nocardiopsis composta TaxID=157465 RepID=A0A7W8QQ78_9ACTN|nr:exonuclease domain-containing protein [Nocardiopsis composta]MBB5433893.1 DNA polymerase-3 subunit epsilon [Nocardiopsis composta]